MQYTVYSTVHVHISLGYYGNMMRQRCGLSNMISTSPSSSSSLHNLNNYHTTQGGSPTKHNNSMQNNNTRRSDRTHIYSNNKILSTSSTRLFFTSTKSIALCQQQVIHTPLNWTIIELSVQWNRWVKRYRKFYVTIEYITHAHTLAHTATTTTFAISTTATNSDKSVSLSPQPHIITYESMQKDKDTVIHSLLSYLLLPPHMLTKKGHNYDLPLLPVFSRRHWVKRSSEDLSYILVHYTSIIQHLSYDPMCICILQQLTSNVVEMFEQCNVYISSITHNSTVCSPL